MIYLGLVNLVKIFMRYNVCVVSIEWLKSYRVMKNNWFWSRIRPLNLSFLIICLIFLWSVHRLSSYEVWRISKSSLRWYIILTQKMSNIYHFLYFFDWYRCYMCVKVWFCLCRQLLNVLPLNLNLFWQRVRSYFNKIFSTCYL